MNNEIRNSVLGLAQKNNGVFKSEKQAAFLIKMINNNDGLIGHTANGIPYFAWSDDKGITRITKGTGNTSKIELVFERKVAGVLNTSDEKTIKHLRRQIKVLAAEVAVRQEGLANGTYMDRYGVISEKLAEIAKRETLINDILNS